MPRLTIADFQLYYEVHGEGPAVVFLHGAGGNHLSWWQQVPVISQRYTCITVDQRAFGLSADAPESEGRRAWASDLRQLLAKLEIESVALVAHSMGGRAAAGYILREKAPVWALVLSGTHGGVLTKESWKLQEELKQRMNGRSLRERALSAAFSRANPDLAFLYRQINGLNPPRPADFLSPIPGYIGTTREAFDESGIPILFVVGSDDEVMSPEAIRIASEIMPRAELAVLEGAGHSAYFEQPELYNEILLNFLDRYRPG
jgi:3-oxoadipate enol-lactonase